MRPPSRSFFHLSRPFSIAFNAIKLRPSGSGSATPKHISLDPVQQIAKTTTFSSQKPKNIQLQLPTFTQTRDFSSASLNPSQKKDDSVGSNSNSPPSNTIPAASIFTSPSESSPPIDASSSLRKPISLWPGKYHSPVTNALWEARSRISERQIDPPKEAPTQNGFFTKTPSQSRTSIVYNFSGDYVLREQYRDPWNEVRIGRLLEDLDALAGTICGKVTRVFFNLLFTAHLGFPVQFF